jgi:hypothetical protein
MDFETVNRHVLYTSCMSIRDIIDYILLGTNTKNTYMAVSIYSCHTVWLYGYEFRSMDTKSTVWWMA